MDPGGGDDGRELEEVFGEDQAGILQLLNDVIDDDFDQEFFEEFRNSDLFADVLRECGVEAERSNQSTASRRQSINDSDGRTHRNLNQSDPPLEEVRPPDVSSTIVTDPPTESREPEPPQQPSSSRNTVPPKRRKKKTEKLIKSAKYVDSDSDDHLESTRSNLQKKLKDKLKIRPIKAPTHAVSSSSSRTATKGDKVNKKEETSRVQGPGPKSRKHLTCQMQSRFNAGIVGDASTTKKQEGSIKVDNSTNRFGSPQQKAKVKRFEENQKKISSPGVRCKDDMQKDGVLTVMHLMDLTRVPNAFPDETHNTILITPRLLEEIHQFEMKLRNECPTCVNFKPLPLVGVTSREREKSKLQSSQLLESQSENTRRPTSHQQNTEGPRLKPHGAQYHRERTDTSGRTTLVGKDHASSSSSSSSTTSSESNSSDTDRESNSSDRESRDKRVSSSPEKAVSKIISTDTSKAKMSRYEKPSSKISQPLKSPTKPNPREASPVKITQPEKSPIKVPPPEKSPSKAHPPEKRHTKALPPGKSPPKPNIPEKPPTKTLSPGKTLPEVSPPEKSPTKVHASEKLSTKTCSPGKSSFKSIVREKSPIKISSSDKPATKLPSSETLPKSTLRDKSPSKSGPRDKSPPKSGPLDKSPSKSGPRDKSPSKSGPRDKSPPKSGPRDKSPTKSEPRDTLSSKSERRDKSPSKTLPSEKSPANPLPPEKSAALIPSHSDEKKRNSMSIEKLVTCLTQIRSTQSTTNKIKTSTAQAEKQVEGKSVPVPPVKDLKQTKPLAEEQVEINVEVTSSSEKNKEPSSSPTIKETETTSATLPPEERKQSAALDNENKSNSEDVNENNNPTENVNEEGIELKSAEDIPAEKSVTDIATVEDVNISVSLEKGLEADKSVEERIGNTDEQVNDKSAEQTLAVVDAETNQSKEQSHPEIPELCREQEKTTEEENLTSEHIKNVSEVVPIPDEGAAKTVEEDVSPHSETVDVENSGPSSPCNVVDFTSPPPTPADADDSIDSSSPEIIGARRKSPTPDRIMLKKKNVIESSSDDGDHRREDADTTDDTTPERKKSSDDEPMGSKKGVRFAPHNPSIERKRDQDDYRSGKFGEFEMERQRKKDKRKGSRDKSGKSEYLEDFWKEKQLCGSFRIPRKTSTTSRKNETRTVVTPLTAVDVPKEKMQFERFRKGLSDKDKIEKKERGEWTHRNRDFHNEFRGGADQKFGNNRINREAGLGAFDRNRIRDDGRIVLLAPDGKKGGEETADNSTPVGAEAGRDSPEPEPAWADDGEEPCGGVSPDADNEENEAAANAENNETEKSTDALALKSKISLEKIKTEPIDEIDNGQNVDEDRDDEDMKNPEIPLKKIVVNAFSIGACMLLVENPKPDLPDVEEEKNLAEATMIKVAWFFSKSEPENLIEEGGGDDWYRTVNLEESDDDGAEDDDCSFHELLKFTQSEEEEIFLSLPREKQKGRSNETTDESCGRQLLVSEYRSGPGDKFSSIFQLRGLVDTSIYDKENFQARCNLCDFLVIGKHQLATHVLSDTHIEKMSKAGLDNLKVSEGKTAEKDTEKTKEDKKPETTKNDDNQKVAHAESSSSEKKDKKRDDDRKDKKQKEDKQNEKKRKRSKDGSSPERSKEESGAEIGTTSTGLPIKIPAGAIPDKDKRKESRDKRSRSRSPRHKRNRSRSPRHQKGRERSPRRRSRSRSPHGGSSSRRRRSRSRSRDRTRDRVREPVVRISRSPAKLRRRSTSTERVEKFLAKTQRRSRSPSNGYRKRHRPVSPPPKSGVLPKKTNKEFHEKMALTMEGKWTDELETKWKMMEAEEAIFMEQFGEKSEKLKTTPESHPNYGEEWTAFWERRFQEIEDEGKDPENHDFVPEWKEFWNKRLRELLNKEYEDGIKDIKLRNGLDIDTLQKLRNTQPEPVVQITPEPSLVPLPVPRPVPPPCMPMGVPPPQLFIPQVPSITGTITPSSKSVSEMGDDMIARAMSISDGGDIPSGSTRNTAPAVPSPTVTTVDIMSTWEKLKSGGVPTKQSNTSGPGLPPAAQQSLRSLSVTKSVDERSIADSAASIDSYSFVGGMDVVQLLHCMTKLEDQLSFFADKVKEYFKKAEEMDLKKRNKSYTLLTDEDFVAMLFQIHDRFMAMIRARILPKDVLDNLNRTVYYLKGLLEHPDCQKRKPKILNPPEIPPPKEDIIQPTKPINVNDTFTRPTPTASSSSHAKNPLRSLPDRKKKEIAMLLTDFLMNMGRDDLSDTELKEFVRKMLQKPKSESPSGVSNSARNSAPSTPGRGVDMQSHNPNRDSDSSVRSIRFGESSELDPWRLPERNVTRLFSVASFHAEGTAVPELPNVVPHFRNPTGGGGGIRYGSGGEGGSGGGWGREQNFLANDRDYMSSSSSGTGRHSPFSRRDFSGNPISANPYRDKAPLAQGSSRRPSHTRENIEGQMPVVTVGTTSMLLEVKRKLDEAKRAPEIQMTQLTKYKTTRRETINVKLDPEMGLVNEKIKYENVRPGEHGQVRENARERLSRRESREQETAHVNPDRPNLPPGILNMIMREKNLRLRQESVEIREVVPDMEESQYYRRQTKKKRRKRDRAREHKNSSTPSSDESDLDERVYARDRGKERRRRRERKKKRNDKSSKESSESHERSDRRERRRHSASRRSKSPPQGNKRRDSKRRSRSSSLVKRKSSRVRRSRSGSIERARSRHGSSRSYERHRRESRHAISRSQTPDRSCRRESRHRHRSGDKQSNSDSSPIVVKAITRRVPSRREGSDEENTRRGRRRSQSSVKPEMFENIQDTATEPVARRRAPPRDSELSEGEMWELSPEVPPQVSSSHLRDDSLTSERMPFRRHSHNFYMHAPSPPVSVNSGSSGYRRTKQRPQVTTVSVPNRSKMMPQAENWDTLSEVSSLGEDKKKAPVTNSFSAKFFQKIQEIAAQKAKVTSVSKTFWTQNDDDGKSLSSISSHDLSPTKKPPAVSVAPSTISTIPISTYSEAPEAPSAAAPIIKGSRNYRVSSASIGHDNDHDREPGELSSSSAELEEI